MASPINYTRNKTQYYLFEDLILRKHSHDFEIVHLLPWMPQPETPIYSDPNEFKFSFESEEVHSSDEKLSTSDFFSCYDDQNENEIEGSLFQITPTDTKKRSKDEISTPPLFVPELPSPPSSPTDTMSSSSSFSSISTPSSPTESLDDLPPSPAKISTPSSSISISLSCSFEALTLSATKKARTTQTKKTPKKESQKRSSLKTLIARIIGFSKTFHHLSQNDAKYKDDFKGLYLTIDWESSRISFPIIESDDFSIKDDIVWHNEIDINTAIPARNNSKTLIVNDSSENSLRSDFSEESRDKSFETPAGTADINKKTASLFRWYTDIPLFNIKNSKTSKNHNIYHQRTIDIPEKLIKHPCVMELYRNENTHKISKVLKSYFETLTTRLSEINPKQVKINSPAHSRYSSKIPKDSTLLNEIFNTAVNDTINFLKPMLDQLQADPEIDFDSLFAENSGSPHE